MVPIDLFSKSSTVKLGIREAKLLASLRLNTPEALRGCRLLRSHSVELQNANSLAFFRRNNPELCEGYQGSQYKRTPVEKVGFLHLDPGSFLRVESHSEAGNE